MAKNKVKVMGPKINATKEIDITDFKLNGRFDVFRKREVVFDKKFHTVYTLTDKDEIVVREKELLNIISTSKYFELAIAFAVPPAEVETLIVPLPTIAKCPSLFIAIVSLELPSHVIVFPFKFNVKFLVLEIVTHS